MWLRLAIDIHMAWLAILKSLSYSAATGYCYCYSFCCYCCCLFPCALCAALAVIAIATNCRAAIAICLLVAAVTASDFHVERFASPCCCCFCGFCCYYVYFISNCELSVHNNSRYVWCEPLLLLWWTGFAGTVSFLLLVAIQFQVSKQFVQQVLVISVVLDGENGLGKNCTPGY